MYLIDTNVISEPRKQRRANKAVIEFFKKTIVNSQRLYISAITLGELRRGVELMRHRGDGEQTRHLESWLRHVELEYKDRILPFTENEANIWGRMRVPRYENAIDKQIAATALSYDLTLVTRNVRDFENTGVKLLNPFQ